MRLLVVVPLGALAVAAASVVVALGRLRAAQRELDAAVAALAARASLADRRGGGGQ